MFWGAPRLSASASCPPLRVIIVFHTPGEITRPASGATAELVAVRLASERDMFTGLVPAPSGADALTACGWLLPFADERVICCCVDYAVSFGTQGQISVRIEQPFVYKNANGVEHLIIPEEDPVRITPVLAIARLSVRDGFAYDDGHLGLAFSDGSTIGVPGTQDYEPWELTGPNGLKVVSVPGGSYRSGALRLELHRSLAGSWPGSRWLSSQRDPGHDGFAGISGSSKLTGVGLSSGYLT